MLVTVIAILVAILLIISILCKPEITIKSKQISTYWVVPLLGAITLIFLRCVSLEDIKNGLLNDSSVNPIKILILFFSMTVMSIYLDEVGFFEFLAYRTLKKAKNSQIKLFVYLYLIVSVLTVFTSNDIVILTFTPFICYFSKNAKINPIPYLFAEFVAANTWSMFLIIGNPTNIYLATSNNIEFMQYAKDMFLPTIFAGGVSFFILFILFYKQLKKPLANNDNIATIKNKGLLFIGLGHLGVCTILLAVSSYIGLDMWLISFLAVISLMICVCGYKRIRKINNNVMKSSFKRVPWDLIPFVISMFIIVISLENANITTILADVLDNGNRLVNYGFSSFFTANFINNIPMSVLFSSVIASSSVVLDDAIVYASVIGSNICAILTPLGALAGIMWMKLLQKQNIPMSYITFIKYGVIVALPTLCIALAILSITQP